VSFVVIPRCLFSKKQGEHAELLKVREKTMKDAKILGNEGEPFSL
jgi:hypothetical protein